MAKILTHFKLTFIINNLSKNLRLKYILLFSLNIFLQNMFILLTLPYLFLALTISHLKNLGVFPLSYPHIPV